MGNVAQQTVSHTAGPWVIDNGGDNYDINTNGGGGPWSAIATVFGDNEYGAKRVTEDEAAANAYLIAAAPDLLEASKRATNLLDTYARNMGSPHAAELVKQLDAAIAKATGNA